MHCEYGGMPLMCSWSNISGHMRSRMSVRPSYLYLLGLSGRFSYRFKKIYISRDLLPRQRAFCAFFFSKRHVDC